MMSDTSKPPAVRVRNGCKKYGSNTVLQNLNMTVESGVTYALLGSSGCGKTTLLSSIVGLRNLSSGTVEIFGQNASSTDRTLVGYMPQETGLHDELTISEELHFFGRLYGLEFSVTEERVVFFVDLLQLPGKSDVIRNLSGGQKRRVSLAVSLLHKPPILILDEPTVGVDPLLRQSIWEYLYKLVKNEGTTVIVTTHYTEESRQCDIVSVMRHGKLLVEEHPQTLMDRYDSNILEDVVVRLCRSQETEETDFSQPSTSSGLDSYRNNKKRTGNIVNVSYKRRNSGDRLTTVITENGANNNASPKSAFRSVSAKELKKKNSWSHHIKTTYALLLLNLLVFIRHPVILYTMIVVPAADVMFVWMIFSTIPHTNIGVVNIEQPDCFQLPVEQQKLGCELITSLTQTDEIKLESFESEESALAAVKLGQNYGYFIIQNNFSSNMAERAAFGRFADRATLDGSTIPVHLDLSNFARNGFLLKGLTNGFTNFVAKKLNESTSNEQQDDHETSISIKGSSTNPFKANEKMRELNAVEPTLSDAQAVGSLTGFMMILPSVIAVTMIWDKKRGVLQRTIVGGGSLPHFLIAGIIAYAILFILQISLIQITISIQKIPFIGSTLDFVILTYCESLIGLFYGFFLGLVFDQELEVIFCIMAMNMISTISQGSITSIESVAPWVRWYVTVLPLKIPTQSLEHIMFRGWSILHPYVWPAFVVQGAWIVPFFALSILTYYTGHF